jgi:hypothetical protein
MNSIVESMFFLLARYIHIVCATLLVGGTLFYEMVVPVAIDDLRPEQQLLVFARARWMFKQIVWISAFLILVSGIASSYTHWKAYEGEDQTVTSSRSQPEVSHPTPPIARPGWWWAAHASTGLLAVAISLSLTIGNTPPNQPIRWMRLNLIILLLIIFLGTVTRQARIESAPRSGSMREATEQPNN